MEISNLLMPAANRFASEYLQQTDQIKPFFHYTYNEPSSYWNRVEELRSREFPREGLANHIESYMARFTESEETSHSIVKLKHPDSVVVIGGQQAGIFTGPLYTIHKVISIIQLARQKEAELGIPVVPIFWIAGEDHDYQEVNHLYVPEGTIANKWIFPQKVHEKIMVTDIEINKEHCKNWAGQLVSHFGETAHSRELLYLIESTLEKSETFTDFFAGILMELFKGTELLIVDSGHPGLRQIESGYFDAIIRNHAAVADSLSFQQKAIIQEGFPTLIEATDQSANLFYYDINTNERVLLEYNSETALFVGKNAAFSFSMDELLEIARVEPQLLSNNVVTRPLMQEWLFPVLAFIGGPGEIAYWAELKLIFEHFDIKMPPIVPRLNITILERSIETDLQELQMDVSEVIRRGTDNEKQAFMDSIRDRELESVFTSAKDQVLEQYDKFHEKTAQIAPSLLTMLKKNEEIVIGQLTFMQKKLEDAVQQRHQVTLDKYSRISMALRPEGLPQERVWNVLYYLNKYGLDFVNRLAELEYEFDGTHKLVRI
ncbi:bacillithiol biosynthesis cysteine-adding enzyme BshC [Neobacillus notoginsengisoli]|uniref:Putative cysteine ligase BshC n=1 Tax=Neobacillus notoginsengisoli TaxID=1578198 RepID=A0A417YQI3_9BACI|nr:bacillithiol biosynthesis cysteine-adding enzyme BshC [Neobacillus notoginsengisoli]RHW36507.1 bacillithiol biosynthesis cysteine-adding enzyme BshC [Neobacillus notoginsengisoli]